MASRPDQLMEAVRAGLAGLPDEAVRRALDYYREYIAEALEAGRTEDDILIRLGQAEEIIALVRAEASLAKAENSPGPFRLSGAAEKVLGGLASSAAKVSLMAGAAVPYALAMSFYITAGAAFLGAVAAIALMAYGISEVAPVYTWEKIGAAGTAVFGAALFVSLGLGLWLAANGITRLTLRLLRRGLRRDRPPNDGNGRGISPTGRVRRALLVCAAAALFGFGLVVPSGLPLRYFTIWNSMKPENLTVRTWTYRPGEIREIEVMTLNSMIVAKAADAPMEEIRVSYEEPDWLAGVAEARNGKLVFREESRGRLPFMNFIAIHEGMTVVTIEVPRGYRAQDILLESKGGHIFVALPARSIRARTYNGNIRFAARGGSFKLRAATRGGILQQGKPVEGRMYSSGASIGSTAELVSAYGMIEIE